MSDALEKYKDYMDNAHWNYTTKEQFEEYYGRVPKFRYDTMRYCWDEVLKHNFKTVVELGTTRSLLMVSFLVAMKMILSIGNQKILTFGTGLLDALPVLLGS